MVWGVRRAGKEKQASQPEWNLSRTITATSAANSMYLFRRHAGARRAGELPELGPGDLSRHRRHRPADHRISLAAIAVSPSVSGSGRRTSRRGRPISPESMEALEPQDYSVLSLHPKPSPALREDPRDRSAGFGFQYRGAQVRQWTFRRMWRLYLAGDQSLLFAPAIYSCSRSCSLEAVAAPSHGRASTCMPHSARKTDDELWTRAM